MTVVRAQDNTTATAFAIGDRFELRPTAALFEDILAGGEVVNDTSPQLGGDLDLNGNSISGDIGINRSSALGTDALIIDTGSTGDRTPIAIRTGAATSVPWAISEQGSTTYDTAGAYGVLTIGRFNHTATTTNKIESTLLFELLKPDGSIGEYAGIGAFRDSNATTGGL